jgi:hypothetical protein
VKRLERFKTSAHAILLTCATLVLGVLEEHLKKALEAHVESGRVAAVLSTAALAAAILISIHLFEAMLGAALESRPLRRLVMGREDVEGHWVDVTFSGPSGSELWNGGVLAIGFSDGKFTVRGETFDSRGARVGTFYSDISAYEDRVLRYWFDKLKHTEHAGEMQGASTYVFDLDNRPNTFDGKYFSTAGVVAHLHGRRIPRQELASLTTLERKGEYVRDFIASYQATASGAARTHPAGSAGPGPGAAPPRPRTR